MFENEIIKLRKLSLDDYNIYHSWRNDVEVMYTTSPARHLHIKGYRRIHHINNFSV